MKIYPKEIPIFLSKNKNVNFFLIYGSNFGLANQCLLNLKKELNINIHNPFSTVLFNYLQLLNDSKILLEEVETYSVFEDCKNILIDIRDGDNLNKIFEVLKNVNERGLTKHRIIVSAGYLKSNDFIVKYFINLKNGVAIPCYDEEENSIQFQLQSYLRQKNVKISEDQFNKLVINFSKNTEVNLNIYEKLDTLGLSNNLDFEKLNDSVNDTTELNINDLINRSLTSRDRNVFNFLNQCKIAKTSSIQICRQFLNKLRILEKILILKDRGISIEKSVEQSDLNIFFKDKKKTIAQAKLLNLNSIHQMISKIIDTEIRCKLAPELEYFFLENTLLFIQMKLK